MSFGLPRLDHIIRFVNWARFVRSDIGEARKALQLGECHKASRFLHSGWRHWGRAKAHEASIAYVRAPHQLPVRTRGMFVREELERARWETARSELEDLEREISIECETSERMRIIP